jgi:REP element-mobilizing transposase RayT
MTRYDPDIHHRRSIRLRGYDYSSAGAYFVTICTQDRLCLLGQIVNNQIILNEAGEMINRIWNEIPQNYLGVKIDTFQIMPNHIHGIIILVGAGPRACPGLYACPDNMQSTQIGQSNGQPQGVAPTALSLTDVVHRFKTMTTKRYIDGVKQNGWLPFKGTFWQRNYYEHIIRNETSFHKIRQYILDNPITWATDQLNPQCPLSADNEIVIIEKLVGATPCGCPTPWLP